MAVSQRNCRLLVAFLSCSVLLPHSGLNAAQPEAGSKKRQSVEVADVSLAEGGRVQGSVVDSEGHPIRGARVEIRFGTRKVARVQTDHRGQFEVSGLKAGPHLIVSGDEAALVRFWGQSTAPPKSRDSILMVQGSPVVRAQLGGLSMFDLSLLAIAGTSLGFALENYDEIKDLKDQINSRPASP